MNCVAAIAAIRTACSRIVNLQQCSAPVERLENFMKYAIIGSGKIRTARLVWLVD